MKKEYNDCIKEFGDCESVKEGENSMRLYYEWGNIDIVKVMIEEDG